MIIKRNEILIYIISWVTFENIMLSEIGQSSEFHLNAEFRKDRTVEAEISCLGAEARGKLEMTANR